MQEIGSRENDQPPQFSGRQRRGKCDDVQGRQPADGSREGGLEARLSTTAGIAGNRVSGRPNEKNAKKQLGWMCA
jgi:hypothetical protein